MALHEGSLERRGGSAVAKWESFYWRLFDDALEYYSEEEDPVKFLGKYLFETISDLKIDENTGGFEFVAQGDNDQQPQLIRLRATTDQESLAWVEAIKKACPTAPKVKSPNMRRASTKAEAAVPAAALAAEAAPAVPATPLGEAVSNGSPSFAPRRSSASAVAVAPAAKAAAAKPQFTPSNREASPARSRQVGDSLAKKNARSASQPGGPTLNKAKSYGIDIDNGRMKATDLLSGLVKFVENNGVRLVDLFRNPAYNPSFFTMRDEELSPEEMAVVFNRIGMGVSAPACRSLIQLITGDNRNTVGISQMEAAVRSHRRGKDVWQKRDEQQAAPERKGRDWQRQGLTDEQKEGPQWAAPTLQMIVDIIDKHRMRISDCFRHPHFNPSYLKTGDESLDAEELHVVLGKMGLNLPVKDLKNLINCLDEDFNGTIEINELEHAIRKYRRGTLIWVEKKDNKVKKALDMERLQQLHSIHDYQTKKFADQKKKQDVDEELAIQKAIQENRLGTRAHLDPTKDYHPEEACLRLHSQYKELLGKRDDKAKKFEEEEEQQLEKARTRPARSASEPAVQREIRERNGPFKLIGHRLHSHRAELDNRKKTRREEDEVKLISETDTIGQAVVARGGVTGNRHDQLHTDAKERNARRDQMRWLHMEAEVQRHAIRSVGRDRTALNPKEDFSRLHEMYEENKTKATKREAESKKMQELELTKIKNYGEQVKNLWKQGALRDVSSKWAEGLDEAPEPRPERPVHQMGFGSNQPRCEPQKDVVANWTIESVDHALSALNTAISSRCNCQPDGSQMQMLQDLVEPLGKAMQEYKEADQESNLHSEGAEYLRNSDSQRLFSDGHLLEDHLGWHTVCESDKLRQLKDDFNTLLDQAKRAQSALLAKVGPGETNSDAERLGRRWPVGAKWNHPAATKKAQFAYNPGPKPRASAARKAFVRYGPSCGEERYWHLVDLARVGLVFVDATFLRAGLDQLIERFEVVDVRNYYYPGNTSLLGQKYVEVLVVIKLPEPFLCEIRLEEYSFFIARQRSEAHVNKICDVMSELYCSNGSDPEMIKYLAFHTLHRPKEHHAVTVFKKHIASRHGSTVIAWRNAMGNGSRVTFNVFRRICMEVGQRHRSSEFWQLVDATKAGCISLFELDPDAVVLLIKFYWRIVGAATEDQLETPQKLFDRLTSKSVLKLNTPGRLEEHEFRRVCKALGFNHLDSDRVFELLDAHGGGARRPPATLQPQDLAWLKRLPDLVHIDCVMLRDPRLSSEVENLRTLTYSGRTFIDEGRRTRTPSSMRGSVARASLSRPSLSLGRRSVSTGDLQQRASVSARGSTMNDRKSAISTTASTTAPNTARSSVSSRTSRVMSPKPSSGGSKRKSLKKDDEAPGSPDSAATTEPGPSPAPAGELSEAESREPENEEEAEDEEDEEEAEAAEDAEEAEEEVEEEEEEEEEAPDEGSETF